MTEQVKDVNKLDYLKERLDVCLCNFIAEPTSKNKELLQQYMQVYKLEYSAADLIY